MPTTALTKAAVLAAGKGTRMKHLTQEVPKPMLYVQGKPILEHILLGLRSAGITDVRIITGWKAQTIEDYFQEGERLGLRISYARQTVQDGTGKAPELARDLVGHDPFLLTYGDILVKAETYSQMIERWNSGVYQGLVTVTEGQDVTKGGVNIFDENFCLTRLIEKPTPQQLEALRQEGQLRPGAPVYYNAGIYLFSPLVFNYIAALKKSPRGEYELTDAIIAMVNDHHRIAGLRILGRWVDVRDPDVLHQLEQGLL